MGHDAELLRGEIRRLEDLLHAERDLRLARREDDKEAIKRASDSVDRQLETINGRMLALERWQARLAGALVFIAVSVPVLVSVLIYLIKK